MFPYRIGFGIDFHQLKEGRKFRLGGVEIPHFKGADGHSDADVLLHAICDAILGAANLGDIGTHFPDTDAQYKNIDSTLLLEQTGKLALDKGYHIINIDSTICLQNPKIKNYIPAMQQAIASCLSLSAAVVSVKATTTEKMGFVGREEGIIAYASVLMTTEKPA
jgi:2-C-methyl-D-erythritol 2,4-cyclodiphosphate synthase